MSHSRWERAKELLDVALAMPPSQRRTFIAAECAGDDSLRADVEELLQAHDDAGAFLSSDGGGAVGRVAKVATSEDPGAERPGDRIGRYKLLQSIGEGGFGEVFTAEQQEPIRRIVALKVIKAGMDTKEVIARFEAERQALALMDHPGIAKVLDAGAAKSGRPYFVMELVRGIPITEFCDSSRLSMRERLELFVGVCKAIDHANERGIVHRDIKPSNVLVTFVDGTPTPIVIDFGIAKATSQRLTERTLFTMFGQFVGTPTYMSPEQAAMSNQEVDRRSDVYSLGVLLYELVTGTTPFEGGVLRSAAFLELLRVIREVDPPTPSQRVSTLGARAADIANRRGAEPQGLAKLLRGDLDWIVMRALEKDRRRRYSSAGEFAADIERHFRDQPVVARPPSLGYRANKFVRRHRMPILAAAILATVTSVALVVIVNSRLSTRRRDAVQLLLARGLQLQRSGEAMLVRGDASFERAFLRADSAYAEAEREDPSSAKPIVQRGILAYRMSRSAGRDTAAVRRSANVALAHVARALALDSTNADAFEVRGNIEYTTLSLGMARDSAARGALARRARFDLEKATALNPKQAGAWSSLSTLYYQSERSETARIKAIDATRRAIEADSFVDNAASLLTRLYVFSYNAGVFADASRYCASLHGRFPSSMDGSTCRLQVLTMEQSVPDVSLAWQLAESLVTQAPRSWGDYDRRRTGMLVAAVLARASAGKPELRDSARRVVQRAAAGASGYRLSDIHLTVAFVYVLLGDDDSAFRRLRDAVSLQPEHAATFVADPPWWFRRIQKDPRFAQLARGP